MKFIKNGKTFNLVTRFENDDALRTSFNVLTKRTYGFDFEKWYQRGYWTAKYLPYALVCEDEIVANVSVNIMDFEFNGEIKHYIQLGTVMTDPQYRGLGLSRFLMDIILKEWESKCDLIYLFANDSVLDFYTKFGFEIRKEYRYVKCNEMDKDKSYKDKSYKDKSHMDEFDNATLEIDKENFTFIKLDLSDSEHQNLLLDIVTANKLKSNFMPVFNPYLVMFYSLNFMNECFYYSEKYKAVVVAEPSEEETIIYGIYSKLEVEMERLIDSYVRAFSLSQNIYLDFSPINCAEYDLKLYKDENSTLFVKAGKEDLPNQVIFPTLSHA